jgi:AraC-like DNA-binding protein
MKQTSENRDTLGNDFHLSMDHDNLPVDITPCRINACFVCVCLGGHAEIGINSHPYLFSQNDIIEVFPGQILDLNVKSNDFHIAYFCFSNQIMDDILYRLPADFIGLLKETVIYKLPETEREEIIADYFISISKIYNDSTNICRREMIVNLVHNFYLNLYSKVIINNKLNAPKLHYKRKKELQDDFFRLIKEYIQIRGVSFFAGKLCITPKYLSIVTKETTGISAKELIDKFAITELKLRLRSTSSPLKEIAEQLDYPGEAFLCKYFKKHTGITPSQYRTTSL